jgi:SAM-dependent methyltransferase
LKLAHFARQFWLGATARSSGDYWERRYGLGMTSGPGSYGALAAFKAEILNAFVRDHGVESVLEFGCGDGNQLALAEYPRYLGLDVAKGAIEMCAKRFAADPGKSFLWYEPACTVNLDNFLTADLTLSLDVVYHLLEDAVYRSYLRNLFATSRRFVAIYSSDREDHEHTARHVRHRKFTVDVARDFPHFELLEKIPNRHPDETFADFFIFRRTS